MPFEAPLAFAIILTEVRVARPLAASRFTIDWAATLCALVTVIRLATVVAPILIYAALQWYDWRSVARYSLSA